MSVSELDSGSLVNAVRRAEADAVERILSAAPHLLSATVAADASEGDAEGTTLLHWAMPGDGRELHEQHLETARVLLGHGADPNAVGNGPNHGRCAPLSLAAWGNHVPLIELLLEYGADPEGRGGSSHADAPIVTAAEHGHAAAVAALVEAGASHTLYELLLAGMEATVCRHLDRHPEAVNGLLDNETPPLHTALLTQAGTKLVPLLLERGADPLGRDAAGRTALHKALDQEHPEPIAVLRSYGELDIFAAAGLGQEAEVARLLAGKPELARECQIDGTTPLFYAVLAGNVAIAARLLEAGADPSPRSTRYWACISPLHLALMRQEVSLVELLLAKGADPDAYGSTRGYSPTPLHVAARWNGAEGIISLLDAGADPYAGGPVDEGIGESVLGWVAYGSLVEHLRLLISRGLDVTDARCGCVLHLAAAKGHTDLVRLLLEYGADPHGLDGNGQTPLDRAVAQGESEIVALLK
jgi:ankyrin repeat protein